MKEPKKYKCKVCGKEFSPYRTTDKYCSTKCALSEKTQKNAKKDKKTFKIKSISTKRAKQIAEYSRIKKVFMSRPENKFCIVAKEIFNSEIETTEIHHKKGKIGDLLTDTRFFLAVSRAGHNWIEAHPEQAYLKGYCLKRNEK